MILKPRALRRSVLHAAIILGAVGLTGGESHAHPHVFVESNLEIVRNGDGGVTELRHVWRFDEFFSSTVLLDFDANGDGALDQGELDQVSDVVSQSIGEQEYFTAVRLGSKSIEFKPPERILVDYEDGQVLMFFSLAFAEPVTSSSDKFRVSVADPTYYVAMEMPDETAVQISGNGPSCKVELYRPDYDKLYAQNQQTLTEQFFENPDAETLGDEWFTWIDMTCTS